MLQRLTVSDLYRTVTPDLAIEIQCLENAFFVGEWMFAVRADRNCELGKYSLKKQERDDVFGVEVIGNTVVLAFKNQQNLWIWHHQKMNKLQSHFAPITALSQHLGAIITGSQDMTIRLWNTVTTGLQQNNKQHVMSGHTGKINCFLSVESFLISGSSDKNIIVWRGTSEWAKRSFKKSVQLISSCLQSQQLAIYDQSGDVSIIDYGILYREKKVVISRVICDVECRPVIGLNEVDDSFLQLVSRNCVQFAQINIGKVMAKVGILEKGQILATRCIRRMTLLAVKNKGLLIIKF